MGMKIYRTRKTRLIWRVETDRVSVKAGMTLPSQVGDPLVPALLIRFDIDAAGGGKTTLVVSAPSDVFENLASKMVAADPEAAERAFLQARKTGVGS